MSVSKNQIKFVNGLKIKKNRYKEQCFVAEGIKTVNELLKSNLGLKYLFCTDDVLSSYSHVNYNVVTENEIKKISSLKTPNKVLAVFNMPKINEIKADGLKIVLDDVNDPGNLGTIIRLCDWFGVKDLLCSKNTVDCYNSKVVQSTMGSLSRVDIHYIDVDKYISETNLPVFVTDMEGENIYNSNLPSDALVVMGNEANGVSADIKKMVNNKLSIPRFGVVQATESLNVATATSIILSEFRRSIGMIK